MNRLHPLSAVTYGLQYGFLWLSLAMVLTIVLGGIFDPIGSAWFIATAPLGFVLGVAYGVAYYYRFEYGITPDTFDVSSGVFARRSREIPYERIQNVDLRQGIFQRLFGLAIVSIETAGGGTTEASLNFVSETEANRLQGQIRQRTADVKERRRQRDQRARHDQRDQQAAAEERPDEGDTPSSDPEPTDSLDVPGADSDDESAAPQPGVPDPSPTAPSDEPGSTAPAPDSDPTATADRRERSPEPMGPRQRRLFDLEPRELLLYSFTSFRPAAVAGVLFVFFFATGPIIDLLVTIAQPFGGPADIGEGTSTSYGILTVVSAINGVVITYVLSVAYTFATYYGFQLGRAGSDFVYERGLIQRYSGSIPAEKVQSVTVTANPLQRLIGYAGLWVETAGYGPESNGGSQSAVPLANQGRIHRFTENLTGVETPKFTSPPTMARRRYLARYSIIATVVVAIFFGLAQLTAFESWYLSIVVFAAVPPAAHLKYVNLGYYVGEDHLVIRRGFWTRRTTVIPYYRIQTVNTRRSIFQRRLGLASLVVDTASSQTMVWTTPTIYDVDLEDARDVHTTGRKRLQSALRERARDDDLGIEVDFTDPNSSGGPAPQ
ncbi:PH domain-containing protein [Natronolimnohabitans innermongolicus]|uniref:Membrane-flanked domain-containing protein n=1 Tax=Natronolimnohabitans innermongolicus JCM 12255 TaxID=1227499 RepID=L9XKW2_9EURY|nr:PH domain-containing protein [Natronolimnohabitans innermongolicus]ELY62212.1 membrane-flanked domain-containing protein [Natronolimnohabitans innermongolicus JCM 12255]